MWVEVCRIGNIDTAPPRGQQPQSPHTRKVRFGGNW